MPIAREILKNQRLYFMSNLICLEDGGVELLPVPITSIVIPSAMAAGARDLVHIAPRSSRAPVGQHTSSRPRGGGRPAWGPRPRPRRSCGSHPAHLPSVPSGVIRQNQRKRPSLKKQNKKTAQVLGQFHLFTFPNLLWVEDLSRRGQMDWTRDKPASLKPSSF